MKKLFSFVLLLLIMLISCIQSVPEVITEETPIVIDDQQSLVVPGGFDGIVSSVRYIRVPSRGIANGDPVASLCNVTGCVYMFYHDESVIEYTPLEDCYSILKQAANITCESHNMDFPYLPWDYIANDPPVIPIDTSNDPVLGLWQVAYVLESGEIVKFYQAESLEEFQSWKNLNIINLMLESYNQDYNPDAHVVWGTEE